VCVIATTTYSDLSLLGQELAPQTPDVVVKPINAQLSGYLVVAKAERQQRKLRWEEYRISI